MFGLVVNYGLSFLGFQDIAESVVDMNGDPQDKNKGNPDKLDKLYAEMRVWFNLKKSDDGPLASDVKIVVPELAANPVFTTFMFRFECLRMHTCCFAPGNDGAYVARNATARRNRRENGTRRGLPVRAGATGNGEETGEEQH